MSDFTQLLNRAQAGERSSAEELLPLVYAELRRLAAQKMSQQPPGATLQATALVHEAWLKLAGDKLWNDRQHFFRAAAEAMRQVLVDRARGKQRQKRGVNPLRVDLNEVNLAAETEPETLLLVDEALKTLERAHPEKAELVKLRFYAGLSVPETAAALGISEKTVKRHWTHARAMLFREIQQMLGK